MTNDDEAFERAYNRAFAGSHVDNMRLAACEEIWNSALKHVRAQAIPEQPDDCTSILASVNQWLERWDYGDYDWDMIKGFLERLRAYLTSTKREINDDDREAQHVRWTLAHYGKKSADDVAAIYAAGKKAREEQRRRGSE